MKLFAQTVWGVGRGGTMVLVSRGMINQEI